MRSSELPEAEQRYRVPDEKETVSYIPLRHLIPPGSSAGGLSDSDELRRSSCSANKRNPSAHRQDRRRPKRCYESAEEGGNRGPRDEYSPVGSSLKALRPDRSRWMFSSYVIQDEAAQLIAYLLNPFPGERVSMPVLHPEEDDPYSSALKDEGEVVAVEIDAG